MSRGGRVPCLGAAKDFSRFDEEFAVTNQLRTRGTDYLLEAARLAGSRRFIAQSFTGFTSLAPTERAVFLLHEVFGYEHKEIAEITGTTTANSRQILARARRHVDAGEPRFEASRAQREEVARRFFAAADGGDLDGLLRALAPDVVYFGDGGGKARAVAVPLHGQDRVARFLAGLFRRIRKLEASLRFVEANGQPGAITYDRDGHVVNVFALDIADGVVQAIRCVVNPDKLRHLGPISGLARDPHAARTPGT